MTPNLLLTGMLVGLLWQGQPAAAQERCGGESPVADLGIIISCDCTLNATRERDWVFRSPIVVSAVDARGAAAGKLRAHDRIVAVNGQAVTTSAGARALMRLAPGSPARLTVERDGRTTDVEVTPAAMCARDADAIGAYAPRPFLDPVAPPTPAVRAAPTPQVAPPAAARGGAPAPTTRPAQVPAPTPAPPVAGAQRAAPTPAPSPAPYSVSTPLRVPSTPELQSEGYLGFGLACSQCGVELEEGDSTPRWEFSSPPVIHVVVPGGPAATAGLRAHDRITHLNGIDITDPRAGAALGGVRPGQPLRLRVERAGRASEYTVTAERRPPPAPAVAPAGEPVRYQGRIGDVDVEVRGTETVAVEVRRDTDEIVIRTATTQIVLKRD